MCKIWKFISHSLKTENTNIKLVCSCSCCGLYQLYFCVHYVSNVYFGAQPTPITLETSPFMYMSLLSHNFIFMFLHHNFCNNSISISVITIVVKRTLFFYKMTQWKSQWNETWLEVGCYGNWRIYKQYHYNHENQGAHIL